MNKIWIHSLLLSKLIWILNVEFFLFIVISWKTFWTLRIGLFLYLFPSEHYELEDSPTELRDSPTFISFQAVALSLISSKLFSKLFTSKTLFSVFHFSWLNMGRRQGEGESRRNPNEQRNIIIIRNLQWQLLIFATFFPHTTVW